MGVSDVERIALGAGIEPTFIHVELQPPLVARGVAGQVIVVMPIVFPVADLV